MKKIHLVGIAWLIFLVSGIIATDSGFFLAIVICVFSGIFGAIMTGVWVADSWEKLG